MQRILVHLVLYQILVSGWFSQSHLSRKVAPRSIFQRSSANVDASPKVLRELYPASQSFRNGTIAVDSIHTLYYEIYGNPSASSIALFLHGGPGAGCFPRHAQFFDPERYQVALLDQRGSGKSTPRGEVRNNTLKHLVDDCERLRQELGIDYWHVVLGGSWGTTLAIRYAQVYPTAVRAIILRGVFLLRTCDVDWLFSREGGAARLFPEPFAEFERAIGVDPENRNLPPRSALHAYYDKLLSSEGEERMHVARSWMKWEFFMSVAHKIPPSMNLSDTSAVIKAINTDGTNSTTPVAVHKYGQGWSFQDLWGVPYSKEQMDEEGIQNDFEAIRSLRRGLADPFSSVIATEPRPWVSPQNNSGWIPAQNMLTCFYSVNENLCRNNEQLLDLAWIARIKNIPCIVVQGGSDCICPPDTALDLWQAWPQLELKICIDSGHSMYDAAILHELVKATDHFAET